MQSPVGYIVQYFDEDAISPMRGGKIMFKVFAQALRYAEETYQTYMHERQEHIEGPFEIFHPTKKDTDSTSSSLVFRSRDIWIWIECIYEN